MSTRTSLLKRFDELIEFGNNLRSLGTSSEEFTPRKARWQTSCLHMLKKVFGAESVYFERFSKTLRYTDESQLTWGLELMKGAKEEIEKGLLYKIERLITVDFFDSVIEQAEYLLKNAFKDVAAVLGRVVIENTLKDIAKRETFAVPEKIKLSELNQLLWKKSVYAKNVWRTIQAQIDLGNDAAHGRFDKYDEKSVGTMLTWIRETLLNL